MKIYSPVVMAELVLTTTPLIFHCEGPSGKSAKNLERLNLGLACLMLAKPK